jgi:hypothetical protein
MNLLLPLFIALSGFFAASALPVLDAPTRVCDYKAKGPLLSLKREAAVRDFTRLYLVEKKPREAFDKWIPGYPLLMPCPPVHHTHWPRASL